MNLFKTLFGGGSDVSNFSANEAKARIDSGEPLFILDVRQPAEYKGGHMPGAKLIPLDQLGGRLNEIPKDREVLCVCASGSRSSAAARMLAGAGCKVINLRGGMIGWQYAGYPVKKGSA